MVVLAELILLLGVTTIYNAFLYSPLAKQGIGCYSFESALPLSELNDLSEIIDTWAIENNTTVLYVDAERCLICATANYSDSAEILKDYPDEGFNLLVKNDSSIYEYINNGSIFGKPITGFFISDDLPFITNELIVPLNSISATVGSYYFSSADNIESLFQDVSNAGYYVISLTDLSSIKQKVKSLSSNVLFDAIVLVLIGITNGLLLYDVQSTFKEENKQWVKYICGQSVYKLLLSECEAVFTESAISFVLWFILIKKCSLYYDNVLFLLSITTLFLISLLRVAFKTIIGIRIISSHLKGGSA